MTEVTTEIPTSVSVKKVDDTALAASKSKFAELANSIVITNQDELEKAAKFLTENKSEQDRLDKDRRELVDPLNAVVKNINGKYKPISDALTLAESIVKKKVSAYITEQERLQRVEQARLNELAEKQRERLEVRADKAEEKGDDSKAQALRDTASTVVAVAAAPQVHAVAGLGTKKVWKATVTDAQKVCKLIAEGIIPVTMIEFKLVELNRFASQWQNTRTFEGITITKENSIAASKR